MQAGTQNHCHQHPTPPAKAAGCRQGAGGVKAGCRQGTGRMQVGCRQGSGRLPTPHFSPRLQPPALFPRDSRRWSITLFPGWALRKKFPALQKGSFRPGQGFVCGHVSVPLPRCPQRAVPVHRQCRGAPLPQWDPSPCPPDYHSQSIGLSLLKSFTSWPK